MSKKTPVEIHVIGCSASGSMPVVLAGVMVAVEGTVPKTPPARKRPTPRAPRHSSSTRVNIVLV